MSGSLQFSHRDREPVVITGMAAVSPLGFDTATILDRLFAGVSGVREIEIDERACTPARFAAPVETIPVPAGFDPDAFLKLDRLEKLCLSPAAGALADSGIDRSPGGPRIGLVLGLGAEHLKVWELNFLAGGSMVFESRRDPTLVHRLAGRMGLTGPTMTTAAACASSGYALAMARLWLDAGWVDACIAGGSDILSPTSLAAFYNLRALSRRADDPAKASRPFDRSRDGFVMGEGGAFFVLERKPDALARGARLHGELAGIGMSSDGAHMVTPSTDPTEAARAITQALADAGVSPTEIDYFNAHAAGTPVGDVAEAGAIRLACGDAADTIPVSSTKSMTGHLVSGAAAFEALACLGAIQRQTVPPTVNLDEPDPDCPLNHVPHVARPCPVTVAASNSFGFGGSNLCIVLRRAA
jgi:3-oxoacyl-[acyl-carrier-protein] synthase II